jgi:hypothetical protein
VADIEFVEGMIVKGPRDGAPDFVKASLSIKREELIAWLSKRSDDWVNIDVKVSKAGKWFCAVNTWKPDGKSEAKPASKSDDFQDDDLPW